jgi:hypothetical protein
MVQWRRRPCEPSVLRVAGASKTVGVYTLKVGNGGGVIEPASTPVDRRQSTTKHGRSVG